MIMFDGWHGSGTDAKRGGELLMTGQEADQLRVRLAVISRSLESLARRVEDISADLHVRAGLASPACPPGHPSRVPEHPACPDAQ